MALEKRVRVLSRGAPAGRVTEVTLDVTPSRCRSGSACGELVGTDPRRRRSLRRSSFPVTASMNTTAVPTDGGCGGAGMPWRRRRTTGPIDRTGNGRHPRGRGTTCGSTPSNCTNVVAPTVTGPAKSTLVSVVALATSAVTVAVPSAGSPRTAEFLQSGPGPCDRGDTVHDRICHGRVGNVRNACGDRARRPDVYAHLRLTRRPRRCPRPRPMEHQLAVDCDRLLASEALLHDAVNAASNRTHQIRFMPLRRYRAVQGSRPSDFARRHPSARKGLPASQLPLSDWLVAGVGQPHGVETADWPAPGCEPMTRRPMRRSPATPMV